MVRLVTQKLLPLPQIDERGREEVSVKTILLESEREIRYQLVVRIMQGDFEVLIEVPLRETK